MHILNTKNRKENLLPELQQYYDGWRADALSYWTPRVRSTVQSIVEEVGGGQRVVVLVVPGSQPGISPFQESVHHFLSAGGDIANVDDRSLDGLRRTEKILKATEGGRAEDRTKGLILAADVAGRVVLLMDDIMTSQNTINSSADWLGREGRPARVITLVLGKTADV